MNELNQFDEINDFSADEEEIEEQEDYEYSDDSEDYSGEYFTVISSNEDRYKPLSAEEARQLRKADKINNFENVFVTDTKEDAISLDDVEIKSEPTEAEKKEEIAAEHRKTLIVKFQKWAVDCITEGVNANTAVSDKKDHIRTAKMGTIPKTVFRKPTESKSIMPKLIMFICACLGVGAFLGVQANSYYIFKGGKVESAFSCAFAWVMEENLPIAIEPFYSDVFMPAFLCGCGLLGIIGLFIWLDGDAKKASRVGHEQGASKLGGAGDFKTFKARFMEK